MLLAIVAGGEGDDSPTPPPVGGLSPATPPPSKRREAEEKSPSTPPSGAHPDVGVASVGESARKLLNLCFGVGLESDVGTSREITVGVTELDLEGERGEAGKYIETLLLAVGVTEEAWFPVGVEAEARFPVG